MIEPIEPRRQPDRFGIGLALFACSLFAAMLLRVLATLIAGHPQ